MDGTAAFRCQLLEQLRGGQLEYPERHAAAELDAVGVVAVGTRQHVVLDEKLKFAACGRAHLGPGGSGQGGKEGESKDGAKHQDAVSVAPSQRSTPCPAARPLARQAVSR